MDDSKTGKIRGAGLSLSISKSLIEFMGGSIGWKASTAGAAPSSSPFPKALGDKNKMRSDLSPAFRLRANASKFKR